MDRIIVEHRVIPDTRTKQRTSAWRARTTIEGKTYVEESRGGATHALARTLVKAGLPDAEMQVHENGRVGFLLVPSFHAWARWTYEGDQRVDYAKQQEKLERLRAR